MEEVAYIDAARLVAYDLPPGWSMVLDERKAISAPEATGEPRFFRDERLPVQVRRRRWPGCHAGGDDGRRAAASPGRVDPRYIGRTEEHELTLRFDRALDDATGDADARRRRLDRVSVCANAVRGVAGGRPTRRRRSKRAATTASGASCAASSAIRPGCRDGCRCRSAAFRAQQRSSGCARHRKSIGIGSRWRMPQLRACTFTRCRSHRPGWRRTGFPRRELHASRRPSYDYDERVPLADTRHARGFYTVPGPVTELVAAQDGALAVFGPGEELQLTFSATLPPLKAGWTRRLVLEARGWCKDMDLYTQRWRDCRASAGHDAGRSRPRSSAATPHAVRVWTMSLASRCDNFVGIRSKIPQKRHSRSRSR